VILGDLPLGEAANPPDAAMKFDEAPTPRSPVEPIDILGDQQEVGEMPLHVNQGVMGRVWLRGRDALPPPVVPFPYQLRVFPEGLGGR